MEVNEKTPTIVGVPMVRGKPRPISLGEYREAIYRNGSVSMYKVSIITSTFNKSNFLKHTLAGYCGQTFKDFELVIVNDGSSDDTDNIVDQYEKRLAIQYCKQPNSGISLARNNALRLAKGEVLILVDDDRIPGPEFIQSHLEKILDKPIVSVGHKVRIVSQHDEDLSLDYTSYQKWLSERGIIGNQIAGQPISEASIIERFSETINDLYQFDEHYNPREILSVYGDNMSGYDYAWTRATGGNMAFNRSYIGDAKFDTSFKGYGFEDLDLSYQLFLKGYEFQYNWKAVNYHQEHRRGKKEKENNQKNQEQFYKKFDHHIDINLFELSYESVADKDEIDLEKSTIEANQILQFYKSQSSNSLLEKMIRNQVETGRRYRAVRSVEVKV